MKEEGAGPERKNEQSRSEKKHHIKLYFEIFSPTLGQKGFTEFITDLRAFQA